MNLHLGRKRGFRFSALLASLLAVILMAMNAGSAASASTDTTSAAAKGTPYKIVYISDLTGFGGLQGGLIKADVNSFNQSFNAQGGIHGHPIDIIFCDSQSDLNGDAACGETAVADHPIAVLDNSGEGSDMAYLQAAGIPDLNEGGSTIQWKDPVSFILSALDLDGGAGVPAISEELGCKTWANLEPSASPTSEAEYIAGEPIGDKLFHETNVGNFYPPPSATDLTPYVLQAAHSGAQCVDFVGTSSAANISMLTAAASDLAPTTKIITFISTIGLPGTYSAVGPLIKSLGKRLSIIAGAEPPTAKIPLVEQWVKDTTKYGGTFLENEDAFLWAMERLVIEGGNSLYPHITAKTMLNYLNHVHNYVSGVVPPVSFNKPVPNPYGPRIFAAWLVPSLDENGIFPTTGPFINIINGKFETINGTPAAK